MVKNKVLSSVVFTVSSVGIPLVLLFIVEVCLRLVFPDKAPAAIKSSLAYRYDPTYIVDLKPNVSKVFYRAAENGGDTIQWETDGNGFRAAQTHGSKHGRIIVYGDSNIQARFVRNEHTFPSQLAAHLRLRGREYEVLNAGVIGFGPDQSLLKLKSQIAHHRPTHVVLAVFADNDFGDVVRNRLFDLDENYIVVPSTTPVVHDQLLGPASWLESLLLTRMLKRVVVGETKKTAGFTINDAVKGDKSKAISILRDGCSAECSVFVVKGPMTYSHFADHYDFDLAVDPEGDCAGIKRSLMRGVLSRAEHLCAANGVRLIVLILPSATDMTENGILSYRDLEKYPSYSQRNLTNEVESVCRDFDIEFVNMYDIYAANDPSSLYFHGDNDHWNEDGQRLTAKAVADKLMSGFPF